MTDRELLELAAKAAGVALSWDADGVAWLGNFPSCKRWNPLTSSADAFELMVTLNITISRPVEGDNEVHWGAYAGSFDQKISIKELDGRDPSAATRRAITRAAAAIQEAKEGV